MNQNFPLSAMMIEIQICHSNVTFAIDAVSNLFPVAWFLVDFICQQLLTHAQATLDP